jgi:hypothetical protein
MRALFEQDRIVGLLLVAVALLAHLPDFSAGFLADDYQQLAGVTTDGQADLGKSLRYFVQPLPGVDAPLPPDVDPRFWRPLLFLSLGADLALFGPRPLGFLAVNVAVHAGVVLGLFLLLRRRDRAVAIAAAALFAAWPGAHEAVPWISARCGPMALLGVIGAVWASEGRRWAHAIGFTALALLSKETAFIIAPLATVFALCRADDRKSGLLGTAPVWATFAVYLGLRYRMLGELGGGYAVHDTPIWAASLWAGRLETLRTLLGPVKSFHVGAAAQTGLAAATAVWIVVGGLWTARRRPDLRWMMAACVLWLAGSLVPMHDLTVFGHVHPDARFLYEPAAPLCALLALAGAALPRRIGIALLVLAVLGSGLLYRSNAADRTTASAIEAAVVRSAQEVIRQVPGDRYVFVDVPRGHNGVQVANNTLPWALQPPFSDAVTAGGVAVLFDNAVDPSRLQEVSDAMQRGEAVRAWVWDKKSRTFRRMWPR